MKLTVIKEGNSLRLIESSEQIPDGTKLELFTASEIGEAAAQIAWSQLPRESRDDMLYQAQSASYRQWMQESSWDEQIAGDDPRQWLSLTDFKP